MLRRTPLKQGNKPLRRHTPLVAHSSLTAKKAMKAAKTKPAVPTDTRAALVERSGGWCEAQLFGCSRQATDAHHRITRKTGGRNGAAEQRHNALSNLLHLCRVCHSWITDRPAEAYEMGFSLKEKQIPAQEPVVYRSEVSYISNDGKVRTFEEVGA